MDPVWLMMPLNNNIRLYSTVEHDKIHHSKKLNIHLQHKATKYSRAAHNLCVESIIKHKNNVQSMFLGGKLFWNIPVIIHTWSFGSVI